MPYIDEICPLEKGKASVKLDNGKEFVLYRGELRRLSLTEGTEVPEELYRKIIEEILGSRARKRAMHLLEKMDRTEKQLRDKLAQNGYPEECIEAAVDYVRKFHYIDDRRYARNYVRCYQEHRSRLRLKRDLMQKGISGKLIEEALEEEFVSDECLQIRSLLEKRHFDYTSSDQKEIQRNYQFLLRRGFRSSDILKVMKYEETQR